MQGDRKIFAQNLKDFRQDRYKMIRNRTSVRKHNSLENKEVER